VTLASAYTGATDALLTVYKRKTSDPIAAAASAARVKAALEALPGVGSEDVSRVGPDAEGGYHTCGA
jgi:hypothetical protein